MTYFPHDHYIGGSLDTYGEYVEEECEFLLRGVPVGGFVVEVGANIGCHTIPLAKRVGPAGRVLAFEPQRVIFQMLCGNLAINGLWNVMAECAALGEGDGVTRVPVVDYSTAGNFGAVSLCPEQLSADNPYEFVTMRTLDSFGLSRCDLIKIDVEGMELEVLQGAQDTIMTHRPLLYVENDRPEKQRALVSYIRDLDYDPYWHIPMLYNPKNFRGHAENIFGNVASFNMACCPSEREVKTNLDRVEL